MKIMTKEQLIEEIVATLENSPSGDVAHVARNVLDVEVDYNDDENHFELTGVFYDNW